MVRIAILGLGHAAEQLHLPGCALLPSARVVAGCEPNVQRRRDVGKRFQIAMLYGDPLSLLRTEKPDIVIIGTPPDTHKDLCLLALEYGAHVFCEKPFVRTVAEADEVIEMAERCQRSVVVNNQYRFMNIYRTPQERLARGEFGKPFLIQCWQQIFHPPSEEQNWRAQLVQSTFYEFGTHPLDLMCFFFGELPLSISAHAPRPCGDIKADVVFQATLRFPNERLGILTFNRISHALHRYLELRIDCEEASLRVSFGGVARAAVEWSGAAGRPITRISLVKGGEARVEVGGRSRVITRERQEGRAKATALNLQSLIDAIQSGTILNAQARHARELIRIICAGYESAQSGETVWLRGPAYANGHVKPIRSRCVS